MPTMNPRITFTVSDDTMKAIDEYRFEHRMRNQTQAILSLIDIGFKALTGKDFPKEPQITDDDMRILQIYHDADPIYREIALEILENHQAKKKKIRA